MRPWIALALVACQSSEKAPAPVASGSAAAPPATTIVGCAPAAERPRVRVGKAAEGDVAAPGGWFPYATAGDTPDEVGAPLAAEAGAMLAKVIADLDLCLTDKVGSVSLMLGVAADGSLAPRAGGIGHRPTELCIERLVKPLKLSPSTRGAELECGLSIGAAGPLRVSVDAGYRVLEVKHGSVVVEGKPVDLKKPPEQLENTQLVVADPDADAGELAAVLAWLTPAPAVLVAVKADGGPPVFLAMGPDRRTMEPDTRRVGVRVADQQLEACSADKRGAASLLEPKRVDAMLGDTFAACGAQCPEIVEVAVGGAHTAKQLVGATSAVRRSGHDPVLALGSRCGQ